MLTKQGIDISFAQGLDTKTDPKRVQIGKFVELQNTIFDKGGLLQKRNGYARLNSLPDTTYSYLTTLNDNLTAVGPNIAAYNTAAGTWVSRGTIQPLSLETLPVLRNNLNQTACDIAIAPTGVGCAVYLESNGTTTTNKYVIFDSTTGQNLKAPAVIPVSSGTVSGGMRVFVLANKFIIVFTNTITAVDHLQYVSVSINDPSIVGTNTDIAAAYIPATTVAWDGYVSGSQLFIAYNTTTGGQAVKVTYLSSSLVVAAAASFALKATMISVTVDETNPASPVVYVNTYRSDTGASSAVAVDINLNTLMAATATGGPGNVYLNITSAAQAGVCTIFFELSDAYSWDATIPSNNISARTVRASTAAVGTLYTVVGSCGLASKAFIVDDVIYVLGAYQSPYQPTYFLINGSTSTQTTPIIAAKLAYENGGGYLTTGLPGVTVTENVAQVGYLFKDLIQAVNKNTDVPSGSQVAGIYSQTGVNLCSFEFTTDTLNTVEIGKDLHLTGGLMWMYDGYLPVEHSFFLYPDSVNVATQADPTPTATITSGSATLTAVSAVTGIVVGMTVSGTDIPANTTVIAVGTTTITMSAMATGTHVAATATFGGNQSNQEYFIQVTYEWTDNQGNAFRSAPSIPVSATTSAGNTSLVVKIPTLRLTMKTANPVKIVIYRWSAAQPAYYQVTSITKPTLNDTTNESITYIDPLSDAAILGNNLIYTTGGVLENIAAPATDLLTLFDTRLWLVDAEDPNLLWYSKQVIENTPVEMTDLFTIYVPPTTSTQGATGPIRSIGVMDDKLIIGKRNAFLYINGAGPDITGANNQYSEPIFITSTVGCTNQRSIVLMPQGLMFQSNKGIWLLDRSLQTSYIGAPVQDFTIGATVLSAVNVPDTNQVRFTLDTGITLMYDYYYGQWGTFYGVPCISSCIFENLHTFINSSGAVYQESPGTYLDGSNPVLMKFKTGPIRMGELQGYQRAYFFYILGTYITPHKLYVSMFYDYEPAASQSVLITPTNYSTAFGAGASQSPFGQGDPFGGPSSIESWRIFLERQRCMAFAISCQEIYDSSVGANAGAGLTISGLNVVAAFKKPFRPQPAASTTG